MYIVGYNFALKAIHVIEAIVYAMKLGSKYNLLNTLANYRSKKDPMKALGRIDFTKYALSTIIYLMQSSEKLSTIIYLMQSSENG